MSGGDSLQVYIMDPDGLNVQQITTSGNNIDPAWSPDGQRIIYAKYPNSDIYIIGRDGSSGRKFISINLSSYPIWRPDNP